MQVTLNQLRNLSEVIAFVLHWTVARVIVSCRSETWVDCSSRWNEEARPHHLALGELWSCNPLSGTELVRGVTCLLWWCSGKMRMRPSHSESLLGKYHFSSAWAVAVLFPLGQERGLNFQLQLCGTHMGKLTVVVVVQKNILHLCLHTPCASLMCRSYRAWQQSLQIFPRCDLLSL